MVDRVKGYDVNFEYRARMFHINTKKLDIKKIKRLEQYGIDVFKKNAKYGFFLPDLSKCIGYLGAIDVRPELIKDVTDVTDFSYALSKNWSDSLDLSGWNVSNGIKFNCMFDDCEYLQILNVSGWCIREDAEFDFVLDSCIKLNKIIAIGCNDSTIRKFERALVQRQGWGRASIECNLVRN